MSMRRPTVPPPVMGTVAYTTSSQEVGAGGSAVSMKRQTSLYRGVPSVFRGVTLSITVLLWYWPVTAGAMEVESWCEPPKGGALAAMSVTGPGAPSAVQKATFCERASWVWQKPK
jgi:hypothetical protein